ncbi:hypothetical protein SEA_ENNEA_87 [Gordonia phage Ennea]|nr:hypothetical protein SEA_ENNEA_87 [Gordonia phage Ennea]
MRARPEHTGPEPKDHTMGYHHVYAPKDADMLAESVAYLREVFPITDGTATAYTVVTHVTASGMGRSIMILAPGTGTDGREVINVSRHVARVLGWKLDDRHGGVYVQGCGMDMAFHTVYSLARKIYGHLSAEEITEAAAKANRYTASADAGYLISNRGLN